MHSVIEHIRARQNKKIPVKDGRHIELVLFGGAMAGFRGAGGLSALLDAGLGDPFDPIYAISAGFCNAAYFLAGDPRNGNHIYLSYMLRKEFIDFRRIWKIVDTDWIVEMIQEHGNLDVDKIFKRDTKLYAVVHNLDKKKLEYIDI